jgi:hypothetical protein
MRSDIDGESGEKNRGRKTGVERGISIALEMV